MVRLVKNIGFSLVLVILFTAAAGAQVPMGASGLFNIPTGDVAAKGVLNAGIKISRNGSGFSISYIPSENVEVGVGTVMVPNHSFRLATYLKAQVLEETQRDPSFAAGIHDGSFYVVFSKNLDTAFRAHLGMGTGALKGLFGGVSYMLNPVVVVKPGDFVMPSITLIGEYDSHSLNAGVRLRFSQGLTADLYLRDLYALEGGLSWKTTF
jgi:hypothetical protein